MNNQPASETPTSAETEASLIEREETNPSTAMPERQPETSKPKRGPVAALTVLLILALGAAGALGYLWYDTQQQLSAAKSTTAEKETDLAALHKEHEAMTDTTAKVEASKPDDTEQLIAAVTSNMKALSANQGKTITVKVDKVADTFAAVTATVAGQEATPVKYILKSIDDTWTIVASGQDATSAETKAAYGVPDGL